MAAWLHDIGKVTTPEYVVDKATKLQTITDRIELARVSSSTSTPWTRPCTRTQAEMSRTISLGWAFAPLAMSIVPRPPIRTSVTGSA